MRGDWNSPKEMARRLVYLFYILAFLTYLLSSVVALAQPSAGKVTVAVSSFAALAGIRWVGYRWLDFHRLCESFPSGCALDRVPEEVRDEVERLVAEFHAPKTEWPRRVEIRHHLVELEEIEPEIILAFEDDLKRVLAA